MVSETAEQRVSVPLLRASWDAVTFVHWPIDPERIQALLPRGLTVDVYDDAAWVSLTPFVMANMRPLGVPALPGSLSIPGSSTLSLGALSSTPETNLRTYVRGPDGCDGLWFLTIDAGSGVLAAALRAAVGAPYHKGRMSVESNGGTVTYCGSRSGGQASYRLQIRPEEMLVPSNLEVWLTSRWRAYTVRRRRLLVTPVEHEPWPLRRASVERLEQNLTDYVGLHGLPQPALAHFSDGVEKVRLGRPVYLAVPR